MRGGDAEAEPGEIRAVIIRETCPFGIGDAAGDVQRQRGRAHGALDRARDVRIQIHRVEAQCYPGRPIMSSARSASITANG